MTTEELVQSHLNNKTYSDFLISEVWLTIEPFGFLEFAKKNFNDDLENWICEDNELSGFFEHQILNNKLTQQEYFNGLVQAWEDNEELS